MSCIATSHVIVGRPVRRVTVYVKLFTHSHSFALSPTLYTSSFAGLSGNQHFCLCV